ncbi:hypothetical protein DFH09DRAFT_1270276 [Mycena vulgaris]|nr:hypothetical protein DFH09DRAFT_1270276 [Mycena vulgaris]
MTQQMREYLVYERSPPFATSFRGIHAIAVPSGVRLGRMVRCENARRAVTEWSANENAPDAKASQSRDKRGREEIDHELRLVEYNVQVRRILHFCGGAGGGGGVTRRTAVVVVRVVCVHQTPYLTAALTEDATEAKEHVPAALPSVVVGHDGEKAKRRTCSARHGFVPVARTAATPSGLDAGAASKPPYQLSRMCLSTPTHVLVNAFSHTPPPPTLLRGVNLAAPAFRAHVLFMNSVCRDEVLALGVEDFQGKTKQLAERLNGEAHRRSSGLCTRGHISAGYLWPCGDPLPTRVSTGEANQALTWIEFDSASRLMCARRSRPKDTGAEVGVDVSTTWIARATRLGEQASNRDPRKFVWTETDVAKNLGLSGETEGAADEGCRLEVSGRGTRVGDMGSNPFVPFDETGSYGRFCATRLVTRSAEVNPRADTGG